MIEVSAPASSANLGSGFDALALALQLRMTARSVANSSGFRLRFTGSELPTHDGIANRFIVGMGLAVKDARALELDVEIENHIPLGVGLGSSAAALVCGMALAAAATGRDLPRAQIVHAVAQVEEHADNAAAAVYGGLCSVLSGALETAALSTDLPRALSLALIVPQLPLETSLARQVLPELYTRAAMSISIQRASLLVAALARGRFEYLKAATRDIVHQPYRAAIFPGLAAALAIRHHNAVSVLSGSGPSVLVISETCAEDAANNIAACFHEAGVAARVRCAEVDTKGLLSSARGRVLASPARP